MRIAATSFIVTTIITISWLSRVTFAGSYDVKESHGQRMVAKKQQNEHTTISKLLDELLENYVNFSTCF